MDQHGLYERFTPSKKLWDTIGMFVEIGQFKPVPAKRAAVIKAPSKLLKLHVPELFQAMIGACSGIPGIKERMAIKNTLEFLKAEAEKPVFMRHQSEIRITWKKIHPRLKARGVLKEFDIDPMRSKLLEFLKGAR